MIFRLISLVVVRLWVFGWKGAFFWAISWPSKTSLVDSLVFSFTNILCVFVFFFDGLLSSLFFAGLGGK